MTSSFGGMAELVDALDSKSCGLRPCQFKSDYPYQIEKTGCSPVFLFLKICLFSPHIYSKLCQIGRLNNICILPVSRYNILYKTVCKYLYFYRIYIRRLYRNR